MKCAHKWIIGQQNFGYKPYIYQYICDKCAARKYVFINDEGIINEQIVEIIAKPKAL